MTISLVICMLACFDMILFVLLKPQVRIGKFRLDTYWPIVLVGACCMISGGYVEIEAVTSAMLADSAVNPLKILVLFVSMTVLSVFLDEIGFFSYLADKSLSLAGKNQFRLFLILYVTVAVLTVFTSNDIIVLTFTPFICYFAKNAKISPVPYLVSQFIAANTWSMMLVIGNPTNIYLATSYGIDFVEYFKVMLLPTIAAGCVAFIALWLIFRKKLSLPIAPHKSDSVIKDKVLLVIGLIHLGVCTVFLAIGSYIGAPMWIIAFVSAVSLFITAAIACAVRKRKPVELTSCLKRAPWQLVPFVLSMFIMILALESCGVTKMFGELLGKTYVTLRYGIASFLSANIINNIPMSVLFCAIIENIPIAMREAAVYATVIGSNLGAFLTPIGALAGIMWTMILKKQGVKYTFFDFIKYGIAVSLPSILAALSVLEILM